MTMALPALILHEDPISAHCYKIRLTASLVGVPIQRRSYSIIRKETRTPEFLKNVNAWGRIPTLQIGEDAATAVFLPESNAACWWVAESKESSLIPKNALQRADVLRWMFWEQMHVDSSIATVRYWVKYLGVDNLSEEQQNQLPSRRNEGTKVLEYLESHLGEREGRSWLSGDGMTLADVVVYAYLHLVDDAGWELDHYPKLFAWTKGMEKMDGYVKM